MSDEAFDALRDAVHLAQSRQLKSLRALRAALVQRGWAEPVISEAIQVWANCEWTKP